MSDSFSSDDSDEDDLPSFGLRNRFKVLHKEKSIEELLNETLSLKNNIKSDEKNYAEDLESLVSDALPSEEEVPPLSPPLSREENEDPVDWCLFGKLDSLQYFSVEDLSLWKCGYYCIPSEELSKTEKCLLSWSEEELVDTIGHALKGIRVSDVSNLNPILHYIVQLVSVLVDVATVNCCVEFLKKMVSQHTDVAGVSFSSVDIFMILFNYGVDISNGELFQMFPSVKTVEAKLSCTYKLPAQWKCNLRTVLNCLADIFQYCKFNKDDLFNILIYLLWMSVDKALKASFAYRELQRCLCYVILGFTDKLWPLCLSRVSRTLMYESDLSAPKNWSFVLDMTRAIPYTICRGVQLRKRISFTALRHLCEDNGVNGFEYPDESSLVPELQDILESFCELQENLQNTALSFLAIFVMHLTFASKEEHSAVCSALKRCENTVKNRNDLMSSLHLQHQLMRIYSTLKLAPPESYETRDLESDSASENCSDDERTECIVENNTEYEYPIDPSPMLCDRYVPSPVKPSTQASKRLSGYFSDEGEEDVAMSDSSSDDDASDLSQSGSANTVPWSGLKDEPSDAVSASHSVSKVDNVSRLHSLHSTSRDQNNLPCKDGHVEAVVEDAMTEKFASAIQKTDPSFSGSGMGSLDPRTDFSCDVDDWIQTSSDNEMDLNDCGINPSVLVSSDKEPPAFCITETDALPCFRDKGDDAAAQNRSEVSSSLALDGRGSNSKGIHSSECIRSSENPSMNLCDSVSGDIGESNVEFTEANLVQVSSSQPGESISSPIHSSECVGSSENYSTDSFSSVSGDIEASNSYVIETDPVLVSSSLPNQKGQPNCSTPLDTSQTTKGEGPRVRGAFLTNKFLSCVSRMKRKKWTAEEKNNLNSSLSSAESNSCGTKQHTDITSVGKEDSYSDNGSVNLVSEDKKISDSLVKTPVVECLKENMVSLPLENRACFISSDSVIYVSPLFQMQNLYSKATTNNQSWLSQAPSFSIRTSPPLKNEADFTASDSVVHVSSFHQRQDLSSGVATSNRFLLCESTSPMEAQDDFTDQSHIPNLSGHILPLLFESKANFISSDSVVYVSTFHQQQNLLKRVATDNRLLMNENETSLEAEENSPKPCSQFPSLDFTQKTRLDATYGSVHEDNTIESFDGIDSTPELETITHDFQSDKDSLSTTNEFVNQPEIIGKDVLSTSSVIINNPSLQNISQLHTVQFSSEAAHNIPRQSISREIQPELNKENTEEVSILPPPPESLSNNNVLLQNDSITRPFKSQEGNITTADVSQSSVKSHDKAISESISDVISSAIDTEIRLPCSSTSGTVSASINSGILSESMLSDESEPFPKSESILSNTEGRSSVSIETADEGTEAHFEFPQIQPTDEIIDMTAQERNNESFDAENFNNVPELFERNSSSESESILSNTNRRSSYCKEHAKEDTEFSQNQPEMLEFPVSIQDKSSEPFHSESCTSVLERQKHNSSAESSNKNSTTSALRLKKAQDLLRKALSLNVSAPKTISSNHLIPPAHLMLSYPPTSEGRNASEKPFVPFLSEEEECFTSSFVVPEIENVVSCERNFVKENSLETETNSMVPNTETNSRQNTSTQLIRNENQRNDSDDIEIIEYINYAKVSGNDAARSSAKSVPLVIENLPTSPSISSLSKQNASAPTFEKNSGFHTHASCSNVTTSTSHLSARNTLFTSAIVCKPSSSLARGSSIEVTPSQKAPPVQVHGSPDDRNRLQPTIAQYLLQSPSTLSERSPSTSKEACANGLQSSTPQRRKKNKRSLSTSPSILSYFLKSDETSPKNCKRLLFSNPSVPGTAQKPFDPKQGNPLDGAPLQSASPGIGDSPIKHSSTYLRLNSKKRGEKVLATENLPLKEKRASPFKKAKLSETGASQTSANIIPVTVQNTPSVSMVPTSAQISQRTTQPKQGTLSNNGRHLKVAKYPSDGSDGESSSHIFESISRSLNIHKGFTRESARFKGKRTSPFKETMMSEPSTFRTSTNIRSTSTTVLSPLIDISEHLTPESNQDILLSKAQKPLKVAKYPGTRNADESSPNRSSQIIKRMHELIFSENISVTENLQLKEERKSPFKRPKVSDASTSRASSAVVLTLSDSDSDDSDIVVLSSNIDTECLVMRSECQREVITLD